MAMWTMCNLCGGFGLTVRLYGELVDGKHGDLEGRACVVCLRKSMDFDVLAEIVANDDLEDDQDARRGGLLDSSGLMVLAEDFEV